MEIKIITEKFTITKEQGEYHLNLGSFKFGENTTTILRVSDINSNNFIVNATCGCTVASINVVDPTTVDIEVSYNQCDYSFSKVVQLIEAQKTTELKIIGSCQAI